VPDLVGGTLAEARSKLSAAGTVLGDMPDGKPDIVSQQPAASSRHPRPAAAVLVLLRGMAASYRPMRRSLDGKSLAERQRRVDLALMVRLDPPVRLINPFIA